MFLVPRSPTFWSATFLSDFPLWHLRSSFCSPCGTEFFCFIMPMLPRQKKLCYREKISYSCSFPLYVYNYCVRAIGVIGHLMTVVQSSILFWPHKITLCCSIFFYHSHRLQRYILHRCMKTKIFLNQGQPRLLVQTQFSGSAI